MERVAKLASENNILIFTKSTCCMCYAVQMLFKELGAPARVHELDQDPEGKEIEKALSRMGCSGPIPAVFVGGVLLGSTNEVMSLHLGGSLMPMIKPYHHPSLS